jgi:hypothetical protein
VDGAPKGSFANPFVDAHIAVQLARLTDVTACTSIGLPLNGPRVLIVPTTLNVTGASVIIGPNVAGPEIDATVVVPFMSFDVERRASDACSRSSHVGRG